LTIVAEWDPVERRVRELRLGGFQSLSVRNTLVPRRVDVDDLEKGLEIAPDLPLQRYSRSGFCL